MKNKSLKTVAICLLIVVIAAILLVSTYARYSTKTTGTDSARVAHWKVNTTNVVEDLFAASYTNVKAGADGAAVIAPGTSGSYKFTIDGDVETAYAITISTTGSKDEINTEAYAPIVYTLDGVACTNFADLCSKIEALSGRFAQGAGPLESTSTKSEHTIGWSWALDGNNANDTALGKAVSTGDKTVSLTVAISVEQIGPEEVVE